MVEQAILLLWVRAEFPKVDSTYNTQISKTKSSGNDIKSSWHGPIDLV